MEWTAERIALLKRLRDGGVSYAAIAAKLGVSRGAVSGKVDRLGLAMREPVPRGPRQPRAVLKTRPGIERPGRSPNAGLGNAVSGFASLWTSILRGARLESAPQDEGLDDDGSRQGAPFVLDPEVRAQRALKDEGQDGPADPSARTSRACSLLELTEDTCRWPVGDVGEPGFFFCGQPPLEGAPYCGPHCRKAFRPLDAGPASEFVPDREPARVLQPDARFGQFAHWDVT